MQFRFFDWNSDKWDSKEGSIIPYDKIEHMIRDGVIFFLLVQLFSMSITAAMITTTSFAIIYEIKDGIFWQKTGGFSIKDVIAGLIGQLIMLILFAMQGAM